MPQTGLATNVSPELGEIDGISVAVAHWHVPAWGGAENLVTQLATAVGAETIFTIGEPSPSEENPYGDMEWVDVSTGPAAGLKQWIGRAGEYALWEDVDWRNHGNPDVLITSGSTTRAVITPDDTLHVNYCHSPPRWLYDLYHDRKSTTMGVFARPLVRYLRMRDSALDPRVDRYLANSPNVARRIEKYYGRDATVLYPPVEVDAYRQAESDGRFLHLGRLDEEKGVPAIVDAFEELDVPIVFAGGRGDAGQSVVDRIEGAQNMTYEGFVTQERKLDLLASCEAVVFNARNEDFGIVPIEANASAKPCLARNEGFPATFIEDGFNGYLHDGTQRGIRDAVGKISTTDFRFDPSTVVGDFSLATFRTRVRRYLMTEYKSFQDRFRNRMEMD